MERDLRVLSIIGIIFISLSYLYIEGYEWVQWGPVAYGGLLSFASITVLGTKMGREFLLAPRKKTVSTTVVCIDRLLISLFLICTGWVKLGVFVFLGYLLAKTYRYMNQ